MGVHMEHIYEEYYWEREVLKNNPLQNYLFYAELLIKAPGIREL
jgi:hypothetical protein